MSCRRQCLKLRCCFTLDQYPNCPTLRTSYPAIAICKKYPQHWATLWVQKPVTVCSSSVPTTPMYIGQVWEGAVLQCCRGVTVILHWASSSFCCSPQLSSLCSLCRIPTVIPASVAHNSNAAAALQCCSPNWAAWNANSNGTNSALPITFKLLTDAKNGLNVWKNQMGPAVCPSDLSCWRKRRFKWLKRVQLTVLSCWRRKGFKWFQNGWKTQKGWTVRPSLFSCWRKKPRMGSKVCPLVLGFYSKKGFKWFRVVENSNEMNSAPIPFKFFNHSGNI